MSVRAPVRLGALLALAALAACSYSTKRLTDFPGARTIAVLPFENTGFRRDLELRLGQAVATEIRARTNLAFATPQTADLLLTGTASAEEYAIGLDENGQVIQKRLEGVLAVRVTERATGRVRREAFIRATEEFRPLIQGESLAGTGTDEWARRIAEQVVQELEAGF
jgi:hypothetical protein